MLDMCLEALVSGVISSHNISNQINENNQVTYVRENNTLYVLPDKFNIISLCSLENSRFAVNVEKPFDLIKTIN